MSWVIWRYTIKHTHILEGTVLGTELTRHTYQLPENNHTEYQTPTE